MNFETLEGAEGIRRRWSGGRGSRKRGRRAGRTPRSPRRPCGYVVVVESLPGIEKKASGAVSNAVFVGYPAGFDFTFVYWCTRRFGAQSPFSFSALDMKTFAMASLGTTFRDAVRKNMPKEWFPEHPLSHLAVEDAVDQGIAFVNMVLHARGQSK